MTIDIGEVIKGDIVRFKAYALRVEEEPVRGHGSIMLVGRTSIDGCPIVRKHFLTGRKVSVEREQAAMRVAPRKAPVAPTVSIPVRASTVRTLAMPDGSWRVWKEEV